MLNILSKNQDMIPKFRVYSFSIIRGIFKCLSLPIALQAFFLTCETIYKLDVMPILQNRKLTQQLVIMPKVTQLELRSLIPNIVRFMKLFSPTFYSENFQTFRKVARMLQ